MTLARTAAPRIVPDARAQSRFLSRREHFARTTSTNDIVASWLADGEPEVCLAGADEQTHGRGRDGRSWRAQPGSSLLLSLGFRPSWLPPDCFWQLAAVVALAMAEASEAVVGLPAGRVRLKWPNDLVTEAGHGVRKLGGVLGETAGIGTADPRAIIGIGVNADWQREDFPADLATAMTSLRDVADDRPVDSDRVLEAFLGHLEVLVTNLRNGQFAGREWEERQVTTGRFVDLVQADEHRRSVPAVGVDVRSGGLIVQEDGRDRVIHSAEIVHVRLTAGIGV